MQKIKLNKVIYPTIFLVLISILLLIERLGMSVKVEDFMLDYLPDEVIENSKRISNLDKECLIITSSDDAYSTEFKEHIEYIFDCASVGYDIVDISEDELPKLDAYQTSVCTVADLDDFGESIFQLSDWVKNGGKVLFINPLVPSTGLYVISDWLGIENKVDTFIEMTSFKVLDDFMIGSEGFVYTWEEPIDVLYVGLSSDVDIHVVSDVGVPILWEMKYGEGNFVVNMFPSYGKATRGYTLAAYSLLYDVFAYPVINASTFFIDDFPAPVPEGYNEYIKRDYDRDISSFYKNIWWSDILKLSKKYGLKLNGMIIEQYTDTNDYPFDRYGDLTDFLYFGKMLLNNGGKINYHGYNHQPIVFEGFDYKGELDYNVWESKEAVISAFKELESFASMLFPDYKMDVYCPPSNVLSDEGKKILVENFPDIKTYASIYIADDYEYEQEFCIDEDGKINLPRIVSGTIMGSFDKWLVINELTFHYVNSHFLHPDDALDPYRGADTGWENMRKHLEEYISGIYIAAPNLRNLSASDAGKAVQRYDTISVSRKTENDKYVIDIENFYDEAYLILSIRDKYPSSVIGGTVEHIYGNFYLVSANESHVEINLR